jgi:hypothetical protein
MQLIRALFFVVLAALAFTREASARDCAYYGTNYPAVYGGSGSVSPDFQSHMNGEGAQAARVGFRIDGHAAWDDQLFALYDGIIKTARANGVEVVGLVHAESLYVNNSSTDPNGWNYDPYGDNWNNYCQAFLGVVFTLMSRYGPYVKTWEIWNEENSVVYITAPIYARLITEIYNQGYDIIQAYGLHVAVGGMYSENGYLASGYINTLYAQTGRWDWLQAHRGRRYPWDLFGYHIYLDRGGATSVAAQSQRVTDVQNLKKSYGDATPLLVTEFGWTTDPNNVENQLWVSEATQSSDIDMALTAYESHPDVAQTFVFRLDEWAGYGMFHGDWTPKPSAGAFANHTKGCTRAPSRPVIPTSCADASGNPGVCTITMAPGENRAVPLTFYNDGFPTWPASKTLLVAKGAPSPLSSSTWVSPSTVGTADADTVGGLAVTFSVPLHFDTVGTYDDTFQIMVDGKPQGITAGLHVLVVTQPEPSPDAGVGSSPPVDGCACRAASAPSDRSPAAALFVVMLSSLCARRRSRRARSRASTA